MTPWLITSGDFTTLGGMDRANHALAAYLAQNGRDVHLVAHQVADDLAGRPRVHVHLAPRPAGAHLLGAPFLSRETARQARACGADARMLVNGGNATIPAPTWVHYLHAAYEPVVNGSFRTRVSARLGRRFHLRAEAAAIRRAPLIICNSRRTAEDVDRRYGAGGRTRVVYYGAAPQMFSPITEDQHAAARLALDLPGGRLAALFIGALGDRRKGFDVLFRAWCDLARDPHWDVDLVVAGSGGEKDAWMRRASEQGVRDRLRFLGFRQDIQEVIAAADLLVHPARYEPYGLGIHESLCRGVPALVTEICGIAEQYPRELAGLVVPAPPDPRSLVVALRAWRSAAADWRSRVAPFASALRSRTWDDMAADIATAVEQL